MKIKTENLSLLDSQDFFIPVLFCKDDKIKKSHNMIHIESEGFLKLSEHVNHCEFDISTKKRSVSFFTKLSNWILPKNNQEVKIDKRIPLLLENINKVFKDEEKFLSENPQEQLNHYGVNHIFESISDLMTGQIKFDTFMKNVISPTIKKIRKI